MNESTYSPWDPAAGHHLLGNLFFFFEQFVVRPNSLGDALSVDFGFRGENCRFI